IVEPGAKKSSDHAPEPPTIRRSLDDFHVMRSGLAKLCGGLFSCAVCAGAHAAAANACAPEPPPAASAYRDRVDAMDRKLGVSESYASAHALSPVPEASTLVIAGHDIRGRPVKLDPHAAVALQEMIVAAEAQGVVLQIVSGYRSADYQAGLLRDKLRRGMKLDAALRINAPPGY